MTTIVLVCALHFTQGYDITVANTTQVIEKIGSHLWPPVLCEKLCYVWDEPGQVAGDEDAYDDDGYPGETDVPFPQGLCPTAPGAGVAAQLFSRPTLEAGMIAQGMGV